MSKSFTKTGVGSFAVPVFTVPGMSVQDMEAFKDSKPSDDHKKIDFFGADLQNDHDNEEDNDIMNANDFE